MSKFNENLYLEEMYSDNYFPIFLVDKVKAALTEVVNILESGERDMDKLQEQFDRAVEKINDLQDEFYDNDSELETGARDSIAVTVDHILKHFGLVGADGKSFTSKGDGLGDVFLRCRDW